MPNPLLSLWAMVDTPEGHKYGAIFAGCYAVLRFYTMLRRARRGF
jgi:hypothetical protein